MMTLLLDFGNTRLKWALMDDARAFTQRGSVAYEAPALDAWCQGLAGMALQRIRYASVVSAEQEMAVLGRFSAAATRFVVRPQARDLRNAYATPETLGVDRWAAAMGAWHQVAQPCLVISAGTATTVDLIDVDGAGGVYRGGLILPGVDLMLQSLHQRAARLPQADGVYRAAPAVPDNTHDAMTSGAVDATCGAIERMGRRLSAEAPWLVTGGAAAVIAEAMGTRLTQVDDLVLRGLALELDDR